MLGTLMYGVWIKKLHPNHDSIIVFIHGVLSSSAKCWINKSGANWPLMVANSATLKDSAVYTFDYHTSFAGGRYSVTDAADALWLNLDHNGLLKQERPIIFVCHSMGGIVVRKMLTKRQIDLPKNMTWGLFLVASPSAGSFWAKILSPIIWLINNSQAMALRNSEDNQVLIDIRKEFRMLLDAGHTFVVGQELMEHKPILIPWLPWVPPIVRQMEAEVFFADGLLIPDSDHFTIAKPADDSAMQHVALCHFVQRTIALSGGNNVTLPPGITFRRALEILVAKDGLTVDIQRFPVSELNAKCINSFQVSGRNAVHMLSKLGQVFGVGSVGPYEVKKIGNKISVIRKV